MSHSRLNAIAILSVLGMLIALGLAARDGDVFSISVLVAVAVLILVGAGVAVAVLIIYVATRLQQSSLNANAAENARIVADAQRSIALTLAAQGRALGQSPAVALPPASLALPQLTTFEGALEGEVDEEID